MMSPARPDARPALLLSELGAGLPARLRDRNDGTGPPC